MEPDIDYPKMRRIERFLIEPSLLAQWFELPKNFKDDRLVILIKDKNKEFWFCKYLTIGSHYSTVWELAPLIIIEALSTLNVAQYVKTGALSFGSYRENIVFVGDFSTNSELLVETKNEDITIFSLNHTEAAVLNADNQSRRTLIDFCNIM